MYSTFGKDAIATTATSGKAEVHTPQRKAKYSDRSRIRLKDIKRTALRDIGCSSSTEIKKYLQALGIKLDLRLTAAWVAIVFELRNRIKAERATKHPGGSLQDCSREVKEKLVDVQEPQFKKGDRVIWDNAPAYIHSCWGWLPIWKIENGLAWLEGWAGDPIPVSQLQIVA